MCLRFFAVEMTPGHMVQLFYTLKISTHRKDTSMAKHEFFAGTQRLIISSTNNGSFTWCTLFVETEDRLVALGSESLDILKKKLIPALRSIDTQKAQEFRGVNIFTLINMSEPHSSIAASPLDDGGLDLYMLDINNKFYRVMRLDRRNVDEFITWLDGLKMADLK